MHQDPILKVEGDMNTMKALLFCIWILPVLAMAQESDSEKATTSQQAGTETSEKAQGGSNGGSQDQPEESQEQAASGGQQEEQAASGGQQEEQAASGGQQETEAATTSGEPFMTEQASDQIRSDQLVGSAILNVSGEEIGKIDDLLLDQDGQVVGIVVGVGGFLGIGEKHVALSWQSVEITSAEEGAGYQVNTTVDKAALENATAFKTQEQQEAEQQQQETEQQQQQAEEQPAEQEQQ
ncbi:PRC-barrel domain-containing protein [Halomonas stenophila]|uniref:Sporulation protein YlmC with PRC-barrel domain n=1 Tax=Halomonas stenophila TaxID=795312 RepID=A0A7W5HJS1_9GAMM|nr:PRC-barrel domain-containing protein [Halomonas stenophila]MBB3229736.1 sporulation protein YlmC with PRC-barrel domain [Halomonas stenophila]